MDKLYAETNPIKNKHFMTNIHTKAIISASQLILGMCNFTSIGYHL